MSIPERIDVRGGRCPSSEAVAKKKERRISRRQPPPGTLEAFKPYLALVCERAQTGGEDTEGFTLLSLEVEEGMTPERAADLCKRHGFGAQKITEALVGPAVMQETAFGRLSPEAIAGLKSSLCAEIAPFFTPRKKGQKRDN